MRLIRISVRRLRSRVKRLARHVRRRVFEMALAAAPWNPFAKGAVIFDLDDTLLDHDRAFVRFSRQLYHRSLVVKKAHTEEEAVNLMVSLNARGQRSKFDVFKDIICQWPGVFEDPHEAIQAYDASLLCNLAPDSFTRALLEELKSRGVPCAIVTNGETSWQMKKIMASGLDKLVKSIVISDQLGIRKPDRRIFMQALSELRADPTTAFFVGDDPDADILGAKAVGMTTVWVHRGRQWPHKKDSPDHIVAHLSEVRNIILQIVN